MKNFGRGNGTGGFSALLRSARNKSIQIPANNKQAGAAPERGGSAGNRKPNDAATQRFMDAKNSPRRGGPRAMDRIINTTRKAQVADPAHRIARGSPGTSGRTIHHATDIKRKGEVPGHISIGPHRSGKSSHKISRSSGSTGMSPEVTDRPGVPAHQSVINRGPKPTGGYKHGHKGISASRRMNLASKISY